MKNAVDQGSKRLFDTGHLKSNLAGRSARGGIIAMSSQGIKFILQMCSTIVLARLLTPGDYGLFAMVTAITGFMVVFKDVGLSMATIQREEISHSQISNLFWINVAVGCGFASILVAVAPGISWFYDEPRLTSITIALAGAMIFSGLTVQHRALLVRQMKFGVIAIIEIVSLSVSTLVALVCAWYGAGYWALVVLSIASGSCYMFLVWIFCGWRPSAPNRRVSVLSMVKFGSHLSGFEMVNYFARNGDNILLGKFWGASALGLYSKSYNIMMLPISQIRGPLNSVTLPALSLIRNDASRYRRYYMKLLSIVSFITMPLMTYLFVFADEVIIVMLGDQWKNATVIFQILCVTAFIQPVSSTWGLVLISLGQSKKYLIVGIANSAIIVASFLLGLPWGGVGVAAAYTTISYVLIVPTLLYCFKEAPVSVADFFSAICRPAIASLIMAGALVAVQISLATSRPVLIGVTCVAGGVAYFAALAILPGGLALLREFASYRELLFVKT